MNKQFGIISIGRAVHFQTWLTNGYTVEAVLTGGRGVLTTTYANGELGEDLEILTAKDARRIAAALIALADEWE
jgi:hypothetical protein